jgi:branched-chain amino acid transport system ATP-binding protein
VRLVLELRGVTAGYETGTVLHDIDLVVPDGSVVALLGANGAGKTTLIKVASGLMRPYCGQILLDGRDVVGLEPHRLAQAGLCHVPEGRGIFRALSVADNLRLQAPPAVDKRAVSKIASIFPRLGDRRSQIAGTLSGGEQQMLALSHAYLSEPRILLLDEVSMGLSPRMVDEIFVHIRRLAQAGTSLLLVEQYVNRALEMADLVYVLNRGRIVFAGKPEDIGSDTAVTSYFGTAVP